MKEINVSGQKRTDLGKKASKAIRKEGLVPCNIYGEAKADGKPVAMAFTATMSELREIVYTPHIYVINLDIDGEHHTAILKELQFHPVKELLFHIDFLEVTDKKPVTVEIPVQLSGHAAGVKAGGKLRLNMRKLKVNGLYTALPDRVEIDVTELGLGKKINVQDVKLADGLKLMNAPTLCVCEVKATRQSAQAAAE